MSKELGRRLRRWRDMCGLSVEETASQAKIAPSTLRRWEQGAYQPQILSLQAVLKVLRVSTLEQEAAILLLDAPRAVTHSRKRAEKDRLEEESIPMPSTGDLWRAMRLRAGLTCQQVAKHLRVDAGRISKWEQSLIVVPEERLEEIFSMFGADAEERKELSLRRTTLTSPPDLHSGDLEACEALLLQYRQKIKEGRRFSEDLCFLALEAQLWVKARADPHAFNLLRHTWVWHADYLLWRGRFKEMHAYATRVIESSERVQSMPGYYLGAVCMCARFAVEKHNSAGYHEAIRLLTNILNAAARIHTVGIYRDIASYSAELGKTDEALRLVRHSRKIALECSDSLGAQYADFVEGRTLVHCGQAAQALPLLVGLPWEAPNERLLLSHVIAQTYIRLHQRKEAEDHMRVLESIIVQHHPHQRWRLNELEHQI